MTIESVPDFAPLADQHFEAHLAYLKGFHERGVLLLMGPLQEPYNGEALGVFTSREAAEEFAAGDPFLVHGVYKSLKIRPWQENFLPEPATGSPATGSPAT
ncbi:MAG: YciI family protein [Jatrophihabitantaceae bacterium]